MDLKALMAETSADIHEIKARHDAICEATKRVLPAGLLVGVMLSSKQKYPSPATVHGVGMQLGWQGKAYVRVFVELHHAKTPWSARRNVSLDQIRPATDLI